MSKARLAGKIALITGASRGIGRAVAVRFAAEGASVAINHFGDAAEADMTLRQLDQASLAAGHTARHRAFDVDIADVAAATAMLDEYANDAGGFNILVNNAGIQNAQMPSETLRLDDVAHVLAVNLTAAAVLSAAAIRHFLKNKSGSARGTIINTTSVHAMIPKPGYIGYSISKGGLGMLTKTLALEFADRGIRVNAVGPGAIATSMNDAWRHDPAKSAAIAAHIPMGHVAQPEDIAGVYAFLASDDACYVTGQTIYACGGLTLFNDFRTNWSS